MRTLFTKFGGLCNVSPPRDTLHTEGEKAREQKKEQGERDVTEIQWSENCG